MSHLIPIQIKENQFTNPYYLLKALQRIGFAVEFFSTPQYLIDYYGQPQQKAHIIMRKKANQFSDVSNRELSADAGFIQHPDTNLFELIADQMDSYKFNLIQINQEYIKARIEAETTELAKNLNEEGLEVYWLDDNTYNIQFTVVK